MLVNFKFLSELLRRELFPVISYVSVTLVRVVPDHILPILLPHFLIRP